MALHTKARMRGVLIAGLALTFGATQLNANEITLYKYINAEGVEVRASTIPPQLAQNGYEIINLAGDVLKVVPPAPKAEDVEQAEREREILANFNVLKRRFRSVGEITSAKQRRLSDLDTNISILNGNINTINGKINELIRDAAGFERRGRAVPDFLKQQLQGARQELKVSEELLVYRQQEKMDIARKFDDDIQAYIRGATLEKQRKGEISDK